MKITLPKDLNEPDNLNAVKLLLKYFELNKNLIIEYTDAYNIKEETEGFFEEPKGERIIQGGSVWKLKNGKPIKDFKSEDYDTISILIDEHVKKNNFLLVLTIFHELLHVKHPELSEEEIIKLQEENPFIKEMGIRSCKASPNR